MQIEKQASFTTFVVRNGALQLRFEVASENRHVNGTFSRITPSEIADTPPSLQPVGSITIGETKSVSFTHPVSEEEFAAAIQIVTEVLEKLKTLASNEN